MENFYFEIPKLEIMELKNEMLELFKLKNELNLNYRNIKKIIKMTKAQNEITTLLQNDLTKFRMKSDIKIKTYTIIVDE